MRILQVFNFISHNQLCPGIFFAAFGGGFHEHERRVYENGCHAIFAIRQRADEDFIGLAVDCAFLGFAIFD